MYNLKLLLFLSIITLGVSSCIIDLDDDNFGNCIRGNGPFISEELFLAPFDGVDLKITANVVISQGPEQRVSVEGNRNIIDLLDLRVRNGIWDIELDRCVRNTGDLRFFITLPEITFLSISGSGEMVSDNFLITDDLDLFISGSGDMDLGLESDDIRSVISGSGSILLEGIADETDFEISGSGDYGAFGLDTNRSRIRIRGSGSAEVFVRDQLSVNILGSGDVLYRGNPELDVSISGSGDVINAN